MPAEIEAYRLAWLEPTMRTVGGGRFCSTSTVRIVGSSQANLYASISAGVNALSGPLHGGANEAVLRMLRDIKRSGQDVNTFMNRVKNKEEGVRLMGFGHRVYKNYDPRAAIVKAAADEVLSSLGKSDERQTKSGRPRQSYIGATARDCVDVAGR